MARLFTAGSDTEGWSGGSPALFDDLLSSNHTMVLAVLRRNADASIGIAGKSSNFATNGWQFFTDNAISPNTTWGHLRLTVGTSGTLLARASGTTDTSADTVISGQHEIVGFTWDGTGAVANANCKFYRAAIDVPIAEVSGYDDATTPSGTIGSDAAANLTGFTGEQTSGSPPSAWGGDGGFLLIYKRATAYTDAERRTIQLGCLVYLAAIQAGASTTRAVNIWKSVTGYTLLLYIASDGTCTDHSGNGNNGTLTGTSSGTDSPNWFAPATGEFDDDVEVGASYAEQTTHAYTSDFAAKRYVTSATGFSAWFYVSAGWDLGTYANQVVMGYDIDGVWTGKLTPSALGLNRVAVSGLSASSKTVKLVNGVRGLTTLAQAPPYDGVFLAAVQFTGAATAQAAASRTAPVVAIGDSVLTSGFLADSPPRYAAFQVLRRALPSRFDGVMQWGGAGLAWHNIASDSTKRAATVDRLETVSPSYICVSLMANDQARSTNPAGWAISTAMTAIGTLLDDIHAALPNATILVFDVTITTSETTDNGFGEDYVDWRAALAQLDDTRPWVNYISMVNVLTTGDLSDGIHPTTAGTQELGTFIDGLFDAEAISSKALPLSGSATAAVEVAAVSTKALPLGGSATYALDSGISAVSTSGLPLAGSASATVEVQGASSVALPFAGSATYAIGAGEITGTSSLGVPLSGTATATVEVIGASSKAVPLGGSATYTAGDIEWAEIGPLAVRPLPVVMRRH